MIYHRLIPIALSCVCSLAVLSCAESTSPAAESLLAGSWKVTYLPGFNVDSANVSHALWEVAVTEGAFVSPVRYTDPYFVPCRCPSDTLRGTVTPSHFFTATAGSGTMVTTIGSVVYEIDFDKYSTGNVQAGGEGFTGEYRWSYRASGDLPPGAKEGDLFCSWTMSGKRTR